MIRWIKVLHEKLYTIRQRYLNDTQFLLLSSILVGLTAGLLAVLLKTLVHYVHEVLTSGISFSSSYYLYLVLPGSGILLTVLFIKVFLGNVFMRGTGYVHYAIAKGASILPRSQMYSHVFTSAITMGFGGSAGLEAPIVVTGSAVGSNYGRTYQMNYRDRTLMLACGASAGIAAIFNAPIAGILFAVEVLLVDISVSALIPLISAAVSGALCSRFILSEGALFRFSVEEQFALSDLPFFIVLGLIIGGLSLYYARMYLAVDALFLKFKQNQWVKAIFGGIILGGLCVLFPPLFGEGYRTITALAEGNIEVIMSQTVFSKLDLPIWFAMIFISVVMLIKVFAAAITVDSGGNGGNFAPSMFVGALSGFVFASVINLSGLASLSVTNYMMVGMAGMLSGVMYAPLTGVFLIAEISGGYDLIIPLMLVSASTYALVKYLQPFPIDKRKLAKRGQLLTYDKDKNILRTLKTSHVIESDFKSVPLEGTLRDLVKSIAGCRRNIFPVVDSRQFLKGVILLEDVREIMFQPERYDQVWVKDLMRPTPTVLSVDEDMTFVMRKFDETGAWNLPVTEEGRYIGFVSKSSILTSYREQLVNQSKEVL